MCGGRDTAGEQIENKIGGQVVAWKLIALDSPGYEYEGDDG